MGWSLPSGSVVRAGGEGVAGRRGDEATGPALLGRAHLLHRHVRSVLGRRLSSVTRRRAGERGEDADHEQPEREGDEPSGDAEITSAGEQIPYTS